ncbi:methyltransferase [Streptomyces gamaensis]|uniref:Methyltransferase n=1 Tax=Streptomyces gamaensis TaxID=1763542 RepID=A0ABW0Z7B5_9ACTN
MSTAPTEQENPAREDSTQENPAQEHSAELDRILGIALGFQASKVLLTAVRLRLFTELAEGPLPCEELRLRLGLHPRSARDFFDALVALGMLERDDRDTPDDRRYANTPATARFLDRGQPSYLGGFLEMADTRLYGFWGTLADGLRTGEPQNEIKSGGGLFETLYRDPVQIAEFMQAMTGLSARAALAMADAPGGVDWSAHGVVADIGCAEGGVLSLLLRHHAHLRGIGFDLEAVRPHFERRAQRLGVAERAVFVPGDFFTDPLPHADVIVFGHILHDWDLPTKRTLLEKAYEALPDGGTVVVHETLIDDGRRHNAAGLLMSLNMLIETPGGFDYTGADCRGWLTDAGFRDARVVHLAGAESMVVARKRPSGN